MRKRAKRGASAGGRPSGAVDSSFVWRASRRVNRIYDALLRQAELGDAPAARLVLEVLSHPEQFFGATQSHRAPRGS